MYMYISIVLAILFIICIYIIRNLYIKNSIHEMWILDINEQINTIKNQWRELDSKQMFEKDDEVGATFEEIDNLINSLNEKVEN